MGYTRFSGIKADDQAAGGAARNSPLYYVNDPSYYGKRFDFNDMNRDFAVHATAGLVAGDHWEMVSINTGVPSVAFFNANYQTNIGEIRNMVYFDPDTSHTAGRGGDLIYHTSGVFNITGDLAPFQALDAASTPSTGRVPTEIFVEWTMRKGVNLPSVWGAGLTFAMGVVGADLNVTSGATTILTSAHAINLTKNFALFHKVQGTTALNMVTAGDSGSAVTLSNPVDLNGALYGDAATGTKFVLMGIRITGRDRIRFYVNRRQVGFTQLATKLISGSLLTFGMSGVLANTNATANFMVLDHLCFSQLKSSIQRSYVTGNPNPEV